MPRKPKRCRTEEAVRIEAVTLRSPSRSRRIAYLMEPWRLSRSRLGGVVRLLDPREDVNSRCAESADCQTRNVN